MKPVLDDACVETLAQQARALFMSSTHGRVFLEFRSLGFQVGFGGTSFEDLQLVSARRVLPFAEDLRFDPMHSWHAFHQAHDEKLSATGGFHDLHVGSCATRL